MRHAASSSDFATRPGRSLRTGRITGSFKKVPVHGPSGRELPGKIKDSWPNSLRDRTGSSHAANSELAPPSRETNEGGGAMTAPPCRLGPHLLALEHDVADHEQHDRPGHETDHL